MCLLLWWTVCCFLEVLPFFLCIGGGVWGAIVCYEFGVPTPGTSTMSLASL